jgi:pantothenate kinase
MHPELYARARRLAEPGRRRILGIAGPPGSGKSTLAADVAAAVGAVYVPMDGFHLAQAELVRLGRAGRKGAPDTFDVGGYAALLRRLRAADEDVVYAPAFDRHLEEAIAGAIPVPCESPLVVTEGNYLLVGEGPWAAVRDLLDEAWYLDLDPDTRRDGLVARHAAHGRTAEEAHRWAHGSDERNALLVAASAGRADVRVDLDRERRVTVTVV